MINRRALDLGFGIWGSGDSRSSGGPLQIHVGAQFE